MSRTTLLTFLLVLLLIRPAAAQIETDPTLNLVCQESTPASDSEWTAACQSFEVCVTEGVEASICQLHIAAERLEACGQDDALCEARAFIYAAGVDAVYNNGFYIVLDNEQTAIALRDGLTMLAESPSDAAARFTQFDADDRDVPMLMLSAAAALRADDLHSEASIMANMARNFLPGHALLNTFAALVYGENGDTMRASHLAYTLGQVLEDDTALQPLVTALQAEYPLDLSRFAPWLLYSVYTSAGGFGGVSYLDLHYRTPLSVRVLREDDGALTILDYPFPEYPLGARPDAYFAYFPADVATMIYASAVESVHLARQGIDSGYQIIESYTGFEFGSTTEYILVPEGSSDPFAGLDSIDCGLLHPFSAGETVSSSVMEPDMLVTLFDQPNGTEQARVLQIVLLEQKQCVGETLWWQVRLPDENGGGTAWLPINDGPYIRLNDGPGGMCC